MTSRHPPPGFCRGITSRLWVRSIFVSITQYGTNPREEHHPYISKTVLRKKGDRRLVSNRREPPL